MPDVLYVGLQDDNKIASFGIDAGSGKLTPRAETPAAGAPSVFAVSPDRRILYVGYRGTPAIESCRIDSASGALTSLGRVATEHPPTYLATDRAGKYLLSAYYQGGVRGRPPARTRWRGARAGARPAEHRAGSARDPDRPVEPLRLRAAHRPAERQRPGAAEKHPRPQFHRAVPVRSGQRAAEPQRAVQARAARGPSGRGTIASIPRSTSPISPTSRGAASRPTASIAPRGPSPPWARPGRCPRASPCATPVRRST